MKDAAKDKQAPLIMIVDDKPANLDLLSDTLKIIRKHEVKIQAQESVQENLIQPQCFRESFMAILLQAHIQAKARHHRGFP